MAAVDPLTTLPMIYLPGAISRICSLVKENTSLIFRVECWCYEPGLLLQLWPSTSASSTPSSFRSMPIRIPEPGGVQVKVMGAVFDLISLSGLTEDFLILSGLNLPS